MSSELSAFAARLRESLRCGFRPEDYGGLAVELFALQFANSSAYRALCEARGLTPLTVSHWSQIPSVPTAAFKELELTCLSPEERTQVFHSSGTTGQSPSRHYHNAESLAVYEASLWSWFAENCRWTKGNGRFLSLTPSPAQATRSSLVHMFDCVRQKLGVEAGDFVGRVGAEGSWTVDFDAASTALMVKNSQPLLVLGTAFAFVQLLDEMAARNARLQLPPGSRVMETGGYKGRSRTLPKADLHSLIATQLDVTASKILCEYGMCELSSQAYAKAAELDGFDLPHPDPLPKERENRRQSVGQTSMVRDLKERSLLFPLPGGEGQGEGKRNAQTASLVVPTATSRVFHFPPWARVQIISPETGREIGEGGTGLLRVFDLANVFSVLAIQTEDLAVRRGQGFELVGRAQFAEPRGCSLMAV